MFCLSCKFDVNWLWQPLVYTSHLKTIRRWAQPIPHDVLPPVCLPATHLFAGIQFMEGKPYWVSMVVVCEPEPITFSLIYGGIGFVPGQFQTHHHQRLVRKWKLAFHVYGQPFLCKKERNKSNAVIHVCTRITVPYTINYYMYYTRQTYCSGHTHFLKGF